MDNLRPSSSASPHDHNIDPAIAGPGMSVSASATNNESGAEEAHGDGSGRKGSKRELSTSKRAAQNRAAQVRGLLFFSFLFFPFFAHFLLSRDDCEMDDLVGVRPCMCVVCGVCVDEWRVFANFIFS